jgi:hypothetical protein
MIRTWLFLPMSFTHAFYPRSFQLLILLLAFLRDIQGW